MLGKHRGRSNTSSDDSVIWMIQSPARQPPKKKQAHITHSWPCPDSFYYTTETDRAEFNPIMRIQFLSGIVSFTLRFKVFVWEWCPIAAVFAAPRKTPSLHRFTYVRYLIYITSLPGLSWLSLIGLFTFVTSFTDFCYLVYWLPLSHLHNFVTSFVWLLLPDFVR